MKKGIFIMMLSLLFCCKQDVVENVDKVYTLLSNKKHLAIEKTTKQTTYTGILSGSNYGVSHNFSYKILIDKGDIVWEENSGEPKHILFYKDVVYLRSLKKKSFKTPLKDSTDINSYTYLYKIEEIFQKHIDKRYFFKLLGEDFWVNISKENYQNIKKIEEEYSIQNDNELSLKKEVNQK